MAQDLATIKEELAFLRQAMTGDKSQVSG